MDVGLHARIAEGSDQDGVEVAAQHGEAVWRHRGLIAQIAIGAPVEMGQFHCGAGGLNDLHRLWDDFLTDPVTRNNGDTLFPCRLFFLFRVHGRKVNTIAIIELPVWGIRHCRRAAKDRAQRASTNIAAQPRRRISAIRTPSS